MLILTLLFGSGFFGSLHADFTFECNDATSKAKCLSDYAKKVDAGCCYESNAMSSVKKFKKMPKPSELCGMTEAKTTCMKDTFVVGGNVWNCTVSSTICSPLS